MRSGQQVYDSLCDKLKGYVDVNSSYDTDSLIDLMRNKPEFLLQDMIAWVTGITDLFTENGKELWAVNIMNQFIIDNPCQDSMFDAPSFSVGEDPADRARNFYQYYYFCSEAEKETLKQALCDAFHS